MSHVLVDVETLKAFMEQAMVKAGVPENDAVIVSDVLMASDLRGIESHGIGRLKMYLDRIKEKVQFPVTEFEIVRESAGTALVDGHHGMGHVIAYRAMKLAMEKAAATGIGAVAVKNGTHFGIAGYYPLMCVKENMAGFAVTNARPSVAPTFGRDPMFGTNPIAFGCPTDEECPFLLDMGTPITQRGKIEVLEREEKPVPPGWAVDRDGNTLTDPGLLLKLMTAEKAALLPLGGLGEETSGYKGYGLAIMVEMLSSAFSGGPCLLELSGVDENGKNVHHRLGHFFIAIDISKFIEVDLFKTIAGNMVRNLRACDRLPGCERVFTAGEKEFLLERDIPRKGVPVNDNLKKTMIKIREEYDLSVELPF